MKKILIAALALLLCACAGAPRESAPLTGAASSSGGMAAFATLAPLGSFEWELAPSYTKLAKLRFDTAHRLREHRLPIELAQSVLLRTEVVRSLLDQANDLERAGQKGQAISNLELAKQQLVSIQADVERGTQ